MTETIARIKPPKLSRKKKYRNRKKAQRAALLTVAEVGPDLYDVSGGSEPRVVRLKENGRWDCSCGNASSHCSHVLSVQLKLDKERKQRERDGKNQRRA